MIEVLRKSMVDEVKKVLNVYYDKLWFSGDNTRANINIEHRTSINPSDYFKKLEPTNIGNEISFKPTGLYNVVWLLNHETKKYYQEIYLNTVKMSFDTTKKQPLWAYSLRHSKLSKIDDINKLKSFVSLIDHEYIHVKLFLNKNINPIDDIYCYSVPSDSEGNFDFKAIDDINYSIFDPRELLYIIMKDA